MSYVIENNVPLPARKGRPCSDERATMLGLRVGQSFLIEDEGRARHARWVAQKIDGSFSILKSREGWRVWRME